MGNFLVLIRLTSCVNHVHSLSLTQYSVHLVNLNDPIIDEVNGSSDQPEGHYVVIFQLLPYLTRHVANHIAFLFFQQCSPNLLLNKNQHPPNLIRPFANRRFNTLLPPTLSFLFIKPCFRLFLIMEG